MIILAAIVAFGVGCNGRQQVQNMPEQPVATETEKQPAANAVYHWKTTFALDSVECRFLRQHNIRRLYVHMFDVAVEEGYHKNTTEIVPIATTRFKGPVPATVEVVPVVYITIDALREMCNHEIWHAQDIVDRVLAMCSYNGCGEINEVQVDCDWTASTKQGYMMLCREIKNLLGKKGIKLSITIRLHQLKETPPDADKGVLMLYNTGALKNFETQNSILDIDDVKPYLAETIKYPIPLDYAYPTFGWGVKFKAKKFSRIVTNPDAESLDANETIRRERPSVDEILAVKSLVEKRLGKPAGGNVLYHLDRVQLENYSEDEIGKILAY